MSDQGPMDEQAAIVDSAALAPEQFEASDEMVSGAAALQETPEVDRAIAEAPLVAGSLWKAIWEMSWPLLVTTVATSLVGMVDVQVSGYLGAASQAAVGLAEQVLFTFMIFLMSMGVGTTAIVARAFGRGDRDEADFAAAQSLSLSVATGLALTVSAFLLARFMVPLFTHAPSVVSQAELYLSIYGLYLVPFSLVCICNASFRAIGNARIPMIVVLTEVIINIAGDYLTVVFGWPVRGLGVRGIALSACAGSSAAAVVALVSLSRSPLNKAIKRLLPMSGALMRRILNIGVPSALQRLSWAVSVFIIFFILSRVPNPTAALAAWSVGIRIEGMLFMPQMALSLAVSSIVGQNLGAHRVDRAMQAGWHMSGIAVAVMIVLSAALYWFAHPLAKAFSHDPGTIAYTTSYLQINAFCEPFLACNSVLSGALQGAGDTKVTMWISIISHWLVRLPVAWVLALTMGIGCNGAWIAMCASVIVSTFAVAVRFQTGGWVHKRV